MDERVSKIISILSEQFPDAKSELSFKTPYELLIAVILSAQCTDKRVNIITKELFKVADTPQKMAALTIEEIEEIIKSCGFYHNKARFIKSASQDIMFRFGGKVPQTLEELQTLDGVGRKTANVVFAVAFGGQAIAVDTHVFRVSNRLGIVKAKTPLEAEMQLMAAIDKSLWSKSHHYILLHGRYVCKSARPLCEKCLLQDLCPYYAKIKESAVNKNKTV